MVYEIDGRAFPKYPSVCTPSVQQVVADAGRTVGNGAPMQKELLGTKLKFSNTWYAMTAAELTALRNMGQGKNFFTLTYYDDLTGNRNTGTFYAGDLTYEIFMLDPNTMKPAIYKNIQWNFIER